MGTSWNSQKELDRRAQEEEPCDRPEILAMQEFRKKGPVHTLALWEITGDTMIDARRNEWKRVASANHRASDRRALVNGRYATRDAQGELHYFNDGSVPPLRQGILFIEAETNAEWAFKKKGSMQIITEEYAKAG